MMTCEACGREFVARSRSRKAKDCPYCGFNNGRGWWPRSPSTLDPDSEELEEEDVPDEGPETDPD